MKVAKFPRHPIEAPSERAEAALFEVFDEIASEYFEANDFGREAAKKSVSCCLEFLKCRGLSGQAMKPLLDVVAALDDIQHGILPEIFDPKMTPGASADLKWSRSTAAQQVKIYAAACMTALMVGGMPKDSAKTKVAECAQNWRRHSNGVIKSNTVANWRDESMQAPSANNSRVQYERHVRAFTGSTRGPQFLDQVLHHGPLLTGGVRRTKT